MAAESKGFPVQHCATGLCPTARLGDCLFFSFMNTFQRRCLIQPHPPPTPPPSPPLSLYQLARRCRSSGLLDVQAIGRMRFQSKRSEAFKHVIQAPQPQRQRAPRHAPPSTHCSAQAFADSNVLCQFTVDKLSNEGSASTRVAANSTILSSNSITRPSRPLPLPPSRTHGTGQDDADDRDASAMAELLTKLLVAKT